MKKEKLKIFLSFLPYFCIDKKIIYLYRKSNKFVKNNHKNIAHFIYCIVLKKYGCIISPYCEIGDNLTVPHPIGIVIGKGVKIGNNATIYQNVTIGQNKDCYPSIGDNVVIYAGAKIFGNIKIGNNVIIGANAVVNKDIPNNCTVAGVPAKIIKSKE